METKECPVCGTQFQWESWKLTKKVYCSMRCNNIAHGRRTQARKKAAALAAPNPPGPE